jgi:hypothetical protein
MTTDAKVQGRLLKRAWGLSRPSLFLSGISEMGQKHVILAFGHYFRFAPNSGHFAAAQ